MDLPTLRLASIQLTAPLLEQFLVYQRNLVTELDKSSAGTDWSGRFAFAHSHALHEAKLDAVSYGKLKALIQEWCAHQTGVLHLKERLKAAEAQPASTAKEQEKLARARKELPALEASTEFGDRYGAEAVTILSSHGAEVLRLHREVAQREGCTRI